MKVEGAAGALGIVFRHEGDGGAFLDGDFFGAVFVNGVAVGHLQGVGEAEVDLLLAVAPLALGAFHRYARGIQVAAGDEPDKAAIVQLLSSDPETEPRRISYRDLVTRLIQTANLFRQITGTEKPSIAVIAPFVPEALIATWGGATQSRG